MTGVQRRACSFIRCALGAVVLLSVGSASAGDKPVKVEDMPQAVQETIRAQSEGARVVGTSSESEHGKLLYELESVVGDHRRDVLIDASGNVIEIEVEVPLAATPVPVQEGIQQVAANDRILKIESVAKGDGKVYAYDVHLQAATRKRGFRIAPDGQLVPRSGN
jgi:hypothetical protein